MLTTEAEQARLSRILSLAIFVLLALRVLYHASYLFVVPFARGTFSDGTLYESSARDILTDLPLGTKPFYLQGLYAYQLALGLWPRGELIDALVLQLALGALALWAFHRALCRVHEGMEARLSTFLLLSYFPLAFYENKYLSAAQGVLANVLVWLSFVSQGRARGAWVGAASALSVLARPNMVLALPFTLVALALSSAREVRAKVLALFALGFVAVSAPMALRNLTVTGAPTLFPAHGGGTSFYIGNNPFSRGLWNRAGGLMSGQVGLERGELLHKLNIPSRGEQEDAEAIGAELYSRAFMFIKEDPLRWLALEGRKVFLLSGNDELTQDYDILGERELLSPICGYGVPFAVLLAFGTLGAAALLRRKQYGFLILVSGQIVAVTVANVVFFTSSQHRLPLAVALLSLSGPGLWQAARWIGGARDDLSASKLWQVSLLLSAALLIQGFVPRGRPTRPSVAHWYNLSAVETKLGDLESALDALTHALRRRPEEPVFLVERASLLRRLGRFEDARRDLAILATMRIDAAWVVTRARLEQTLLARGSTAPFESALP